MNDIENLLAKHLSGESTPEENALVLQFKQEHPEEYKALRALWTAKPIEPQSFDSAAAWKAVEQKAKQAELQTQAQKPVEELSSEKPLRKVSATKTVGPKKEAKVHYLRQFRKYAAVLLVLLAASYLFYTLNSSSNMLELTAQGQKEQVQLADGSVVYLNEGASFSYPKAFADNLRVVELKGEAFFEVAKDANRPFIVYTENSKVEVLGTSFNVDSEAQQTIVSVATGKVKVAAANKSESAILTPNESARVSQNKVQKANNDPNYLAWKTGVFKFENTPIPTVLAELNKYYEQPITLREKATATCRLSSTFENVELAEIVEIIKLTCNLNVNQKIEQYELY